MIVIYVILKFLLGQYHQNRFLLEMAQKHYITVLEEKTDSKIKVAPIKDISPIGDEGSFSVKLRILLDHIDRKKI